MSEIARAAGIRALQSPLNDEQWRPLEPSETRLAPLAEAPALEVLNVMDFGHADPEILRPFVGHPTLRAGIWGFGSKRKNAAAAALLPLPQEPFA